MSLTFAQIETANFGTISFMAGDEGLRGVAFTSLKQLKQTVHFPDEAPSLTGLQTLSTLMVAMNEYLDGIRRYFAVAIDWRVISGFQQQVLRQTAKIPYGQVLTYAALAKKLDKPGAARAVGAALAKNPMPIVIPCHRVIGSDHALSGYLGGVDVKASLLTLEGFKIQKNKVVI